MEIDDDQSKHRQVFDFNLVVIIVPFTQEPAGKPLKCVDKSRVIDKSS